MEKTIEQRIAEGVANGIQQAKNAETEMKRKRGKDTVVGYILFFVIFFLSLVALSFIREKFGIEKNDFSKNYAYPLAVFTQLSFTIFFYRNEFRTHLKGTVFMTLVNSLVVGYFVALVIK